MKKLFLAAVMLAASASARISAQTPAPTLIPFQGRLTDQNGVAYANNQYTIVFQLYDQAVGGTLLWSERHEKVGVLNGMLNVFLGSISSLANVAFSQTRHLGITVDGDNNPNTPDPEMVPRQIIIPAFWAKNSEKLAGYDWSTLLTSGNNPATGQLRGDKIAPGTLDLVSLSPAALASFGSTIVQNGSVPGLTAMEAINSRDTLALVRDQTGLPRMARASAGTSDRATFYGFALASAAQGQDVGAHQYGPLGGFVNLVSGRNYFLSTNAGAITAEYPAGAPVYVGHALSSSVLFADPFGVSRTWGERNFWGNGADGQFVSSGTNLFASDLDGPVVVKQFSSLTINANDLVSTTNRCRGLVIYVNGNATINGTLSMTARGANVDPALPDSIPGTGIRIVRRKVGGTDTLGSSDLGGNGAGGVGAAWRNLEAIQPPVVGNGAFYAISRIGGAGGVGGPYGAESGRSISNGSGGGSTGWGAGTGSGGSGAAGTCYSGGAGGGGTSGGGNGGNGGANGGAGGVGYVLGGAGAEKGGGLLILFVRGNLTIGPQGKVVADGSQAGQGAIDKPGGGSGGGRIIVLYGSSLSGSAAIKASGGAALPGESGNLGAAGGNGSVTIDKIDP